MPRDLHLDCEYLLVDCLFSLNLTQINDVKKNLGRIPDVFFVSTNINGVLSRAGHPLLRNSMHHVALQFETAV